MEDSSMTDAGSGQGEQQLSIEQELDEKYE